MRQPTPTRRTWSDPWETPGDDEAHGFEAQPSLVEAGGMIGALVRDRAGEPLGRIHDLVLDRDLGVVAYVLVAVAVRGAEPSMVAVAWEALQTARDPGEWSCHLDRTAFVGLAPAGTGEPEADIDWLEHRAERFGR